MQSKREIFVFPLVFLDKGKTVITVKVCLWFIGQRARGAIAKRNSPQGDTQSQTATGASRRR